MRFGGFGAGAVDGRTDDKAGDGGKGSGVRPAVVNRLFDEIQLVQRKPHQELTLRRQRPSPVPFLLRLRNRGDSP